MYITSPGTVVELPRKPEAVEKYNNINNPNNEQKEMVATLV